jgi:hypothetical protein
MKHSFKLSRIISVMAFGLFVAQPIYADDTQAWPGTLYRNGGYFGPQNSDESIENPVDVTNEVPSTEAQDPPLGTLYRNGGYFGDANSDESIENPPDDVADENQANTADNEIRAKSASKSPCNTRSGSQVC